MRCDLCGPFTPQEAADLVLGVWTPERTGYLHPECQAAISRAAKQMADDIDAKLADDIYRQISGGTINAS